MSMNSRHVLDLRNTAFEQRHGDIIAVGTWFLLDDDAEPCLVLMRRRDFGRFDVEKVTPCVVRMQNLWIYDQERGQPEAARRDARHRRRHAPGHAGALDHPRPHR